MLKVQGNAGLPGAISKRCFPGSSGLGGSSFTWLPCSSIKPCKGHKHQWKGKSHEEGKEKKINITDIANLSPTLPLSPSSFHPSEQEKIEVVIHLPHLSFLSHWTLLVKWSFLWNNNTLSRHRWFSLVSITNYPLKKFHLTLLIYSSFNL